MYEFSRIAIIYNPTKDFRKVESFIQLSHEKRRDIQFDIFHTDNFEDIEDKAEWAISKGYEINIAAGGDGTVLGVMNAAIKHNKPFSVLPLGTGNDFAKSLSINNLQDTVDVLANGMLKTVDAGMCRYCTDEGSEKEMFFCSTAGVGALAKVFSYESNFITKLLKNMLGNGVWPLLTIVSLSTSRNSESVLVFDQREIRADIRLFEISKVPIAGGTYFTPYAGTANQRFDAWMLHDIGMIKCLDVFLKAGRPGNEHFQCEGFEYFTENTELNRYGVSNLTEITINPVTALPVHIHGDKVGRTPMHCKIASKKVRVLC